MRLKKQKIIHFFLSSYLRASYASVAKLFLVCLFLTAASVLRAQTPETFPHRVISMAPNLTEIVYDIGAGDELVGVTDYCRFPPEAKRKEKIGGWLNPNYEKILSLKPDLVLALQFHDGEGCFERL